MGLTSGEGRAGRGEGGNKASGKGFEGGGNSWRTSHLRKKFKGTSSKKERGGGEKEKVWSKGVLFRSYSKPP